MTPVFVYGSLMSGEQNDGLLAETENPRCRTWNPV